jgi:23S rRNA (guanosine2251-2'-O)-methyltransferase
MQNYADRKRFYDRFLTIYGRKPVLEALQDKTLHCQKLHLADSNKPGGIIDDITHAAEKLKVEIQYHSKQALSRISKNGREDQGVALDIQFSSYQPLEDFLQQANKKPFHLIALDRVTNPQNLGMIIRSIAAGFVDGLLLPKQGCAPLSPMVIKASAGTLFRCPIIYCDQLSDALQQLKQHTCDISVLSSHAKQSIFDYQPKHSSVMILGNETDGVSDEISKLATQRLSIPMREGVESLNVAVTAGLLAYLPMLLKK